MKPAHDAVLLTDRAGAQVQCACGWLSPPRRIVHGWMPGARQIERDTALADWTAHQLEETPCPTPS